MDANLGYTFQKPTWTGNLRSICLQCTDLFSEFGKYIAPAYHHDRCERSVQMRLYTMHKREFVLLFLGFFASLLLSVFLGLAGPPVVSESIQKASSFMNRSSMSTGPFVIMSPRLTTYSQEMWLMGRININNKDDETLQKPFHVSVAIDGIADSSQPVPILVEDKAHNKTRHLKCSGATCSDFVVLHLGFLEYFQYIIIIRFYGLEGIDQKYVIKEVEFEFKTYNSSFSQLEIWFRFVYLILTFLVTVWFAHKLGKFASCDWSIEQKWMTILLPLLLLYNDPVYPMTFLVNSWIPGMFDSLFQSTFLCSLLLFWMCIYHGIRQNKRLFVTFYAPKLVLVFILWFTSVTLATWEEYNGLRDPTYMYEPDSGNYYGFKIVFFTIGGIYLIYLIYLIVRACSELRSMPYFDVRLKFLTFLMVVVIVISVTVFITRFGFRNLQENFVADLSISYNESCTQFMTIYGLFNFYLYTMAYVYSPSRNAKFETRFKDNPTFSMINDSDEEVIYGSDAEERPLNTNYGREEESD